MIGGRNAELRLFKRLFLPPKPSAPTQFGQNFWFFVNDVIENLLNHGQIPTQIFFRLAKLFTGELRIQVPDIRFLNFFGRIKERRFHVMQRAKGFLKLGSQPRRHREH